MIPMWLYLVLVAVDAVLLFAGYAAASVALGVLLLVDFSIALIAWAASR